jgi:phosphoglycolate phosphatase-like HAD superfamily hydrolase
MRSKPKSSTDADWLITLLESLFRAKSAARSRLLTLSSAHAGSLGIPPRRCAFVGDSVETDARASASAGLISVWLDRADSRVDPGPDVQLIDSLAELPALLGARTD